ncbi:MAG TPA: DUF2252 domain-containing protein [Bryobacteraceae bacterium]|jgi:uncharacterized protein (DUF2252 family)|nr:DUF2252 domain-containing protein [Bryobacteraceae bacterium]
MPEAKRAAADKRKERISAGRQARRRVSRSGLGSLESKKRSFDPIDLLLQSNAERLPKLLPVKYQRMAQSPFAFFRGAVSIMAADLASHPHSDITVQLCGDAHVQNLGSFETPDGRIVFDINDFDETIAGPWEWDVKRMAASIVLAGLESAHSKTSCEEAVEVFARSYNGAIQRLAAIPILDAARHQIHRLKRAQVTSAALSQAERARPTDLLAKYTEKSANGQFHFRSMKPILYRVNGPKRQEILSALSVYRDSLPPERLHLFHFFHPLDVGFKVVGTGSVGLRDYVVLMEGNGKSDPLFLQIKQEVASAYAPYLNAVQYLHQGKRVAEGQRRLQPSSDLLLGWTRIGEHDFLVRQLNDHKGSIQIDNLRGRGLSALAEIAGELLARGHARSGDVLAIHGYIGNSGKATEALVNYGLDYAKLTDSDFDFFQKAIKQGRIKVSEPR